MTDTDEEKFSISQLSAETSELSDELWFASKCLSLLERYRHHLTVFCLRCECGRRIDKSVFNELENEFIHVANHRLYGDVNGVNGVIGVNRLKDHTIVVESNENNAVINDLNTDQCVDHSSDCLEGVVVKQEMSDTIEENTRLMDINTDDCFNYYSLDIKNRQLKSQESSLTHIDIQVEGDCNDSDIDSAFDIDNQDIKISPVSSISTRPTTRSQANADHSSKTTPDALKSTQRYVRAGKSFHLWTVKEKLDIIDKWRHVYRENTSRTARHEGVHRCTLMGWVQLEAKLRKYAEKNASQIETRYTIKDRPKTDFAKWKLMETEVYEWLTAERKRGNAVTRAGMLAKAEQVFRLRYPDSEGQFKASIGWVTRFIKRYDIEITRDK